MIHTLNHRQKITWYRMQRFKHTALLNYVHIFFFHFFIRLKQVPEVTVHITNTGFIEQQVPPTDVVRQCVEALDD